jgi:ribosomal protein L11 methyltransferase
MNASTWCWRRRILPHEEAAWRARLADLPQDRLAWIEKPGRRTLWIEYYAERFAEARRLAARWKGQVWKMAAREWLSPRHSVPPLRLSGDLWIVPEPVKKAEFFGKTILCIPAGMAFGSGEHETTGMMARAMARKRLAGLHVLDLGTGSGILALVARVQGAGEVRATDFDPVAIRVARQNEAQNFSRPMISWAVEDVLTLRGKAWDLIVANLFSDLLIAAAPRIVRRLRKNGELWLSGILQSQKAGVVRAYQKYGCRLLETKRKGKWVFLRLAR